MYVITLDIECHGKVIDLDYRNSDVRLIHRAGDFQTVYARDNKHTTEELNELKRELRKDLITPTLIPIQSHTKKKKEKYSEHILGINRGTTFGNITFIPLFNLIENAFKYYENPETFQYVREPIFDPIIRTDKLCDISPELKFDKLYGNEYPAYPAGIHIISIHKYDSRNHKFKYVYPIIREKEEDREKEGDEKEKENNTNLMFLDSWRDLINQFPNQNQNSEDWINEFLWGQDTEFIKPFTRDNIQGKNIEIFKETRENKERYPVLPVIKLIRLSYLIYCLKNIIPDVKINIIDNTCSNLLPGIQIPNTRETPKEENNDIEEGYPNQYWGGKKSISRKKKKKTSKIKTKNNTSKRYKKTN